MVILHIAKVTEDQANGVNVVVPEHVRQQAKTETVALLNIRGFRPDGIETVFLYERGTKISNLDAPFNKPDIVVFHQVYEVEYLILSAELRKRKIPYIVVPHGSLTVGAQRIKRVKKLVGNLLFSAFFENAVVLQCLSQAELDATSFCVQKMIATNGITPPHEQKTSFREECIRFVYIGRLSLFHKGIDILLDAFKMWNAPPCTEKCELHIYGPDSEGSHDCIRQMIAERNLTDIVYLNPAVFGDEKKNALLDADAFIQTSRFEGMPMGILEAMSYGLPCIITEGTTLGESINKYNAGWVAKTNAEGVYQMLVKAIEEKQQLADKSTNAKTLIEQNFSWDKIAKETIQIYKKILEETKV